LFASISFLPQHLLPPPSLSSFSLFFLFLFLSLLPVFILFYSLFLLLFLATSCRHYYAVTFSSRCYGITVCSSVLLE
jgi:hypothetical protein